MMTGSREQLIVGVTSAGWRKAAKPRGYFPVAKWPRQMAWRSLALNFQYHCILTKRPGHYNLFTPVLDSIKVDTISAY